MLKIVIVDDEQLIIHHLIKIISTFDIPHQITGTANNTRHALTIIKETHPNLVITDIRMGASNGLDLCETLSTTMPHTKILILSGYDDFTYAQKALRYNVASYLLKPINENELYTQLLQVHKLILKQDEEAAKDFQLKKQIHECLPMMQEWFYRIIRENRNSPDVIDSTFRLFNIDIFNSAYQALYISFSEENKIEQIEQDYITISRMAQTITLFIEDYFKMIYFYDSASITIVLSAESDNGEVMQKHTYSLAERIRQFLDFNYTFPFSVGQSTVVHNITHVRQAVKDAISASKYSFYIGFNKIICITDVELRDKNEVVTGFNYIQEDILKYLKTCDFDTASRFLNIFHLNVLQLHGDQSVSKNKFLELYYYLSNAVSQEFGIEVSLSSETADKIKNSTNLDDIKMILSKYIKDTISVIEQLRTNKSRKFIESAKSYIDSHYAQDISLETIAYDIGLSSCYLSTLFKNITKTSIKEYIIDTRIEASKKFLKDVNLKIYEVAAKVGYNDSRYFSQLFRKKTGYTPGQYRELLDSNNTEI